MIGRTPINGPYYYWDPEDSFNELDMVFQDMQSVYDAILEDNGLCSVIDEEARFHQPDGKEVDIPFKVIFILYIDFLKCYLNMGHEVDFKNTDSLLLPMALNLKFKWDLFGIDYFDEYMNNATVKYINDGILPVMKDYAKNDGPEFMFLKVAKGADDRLRKQYINLMFSATQYIMHENPINIKKEYQWLASIRKISI